MRTFTIRVELHHPLTHDSASLAVLHEKMTLQGFTQEIQYKDGTRARLPSGEYSWITREPETKEQVMAMVEAAVKATKRKAAIVVTGPDGRTSVGLQPITTK